MFAAETPVDMATAAMRDCPADVDALPSKVVILVEMVEAAARDGGRTSKATMTPPEACSSRSADSRRRRVALVREVMVTAEALTWATAATLRRMTLLNESPAAEADV